MPKTLILIPTLNERQTIAALLSELLALPVPELEIAVIDDQSRDGTVEIVRELAARRGRVRLLSRQGPAGRGLAGRDAFLYALECGAERVLEMDADFSHQPRHVPALLEALSRCDMAVGSRMVPGGSDTDRSRGRRWLTLAANAYARRLLGLPVTDVNSGFRCFNRRALEAIDPSSLRSRGPSIIHESLVRAVRAGMRIEEVPIEFLERRAGYSKLSLPRLISSYFWVLRMTWWNR
ncbi:MAG: polyprenol monophosphomannose synthase [Elusimicrobia bacterium]|nr:polyprenol monophosphomannose synthase [Elusimicrobiota bacterium]